MKNTKIIKNVLISVSNTSGIIKFSKSLISRDIKIFATQGTANLLEKNCINVTRISDYTQFPELMNGRIKSLHHKIYAGILAQPKIDAKIMQKHNIIAIDMVIANFYPFDIFSNQKNLQFKNVIEHIDIGGPTMVRAAAKNHHNVLVVVQPDSYKSILEEMNLNNNTISYTTKLHFATIAYEYIINYDHNIYQYLHKHNYISDKKKNILPSCLTIHLKKKENLCYGENKQQKAAWYTNPSIHTPGKMKIKKIQGKILSFNNMSDIHSALSCIHEFNKYTCAIIKHGNPCGISTSNNNIYAYSLAYNADPISAFGGLIAFNSILNDTVARKIIETQFSEIILAPDFTKKAQNIFKNKPNLRIIKYYKNYNYLDYPIDMKSIYGDVLIQTNLENTIDQTQWKIVSKKHPNTAEMNDAKFALKVVKHLKSNAIVFVKNKTTISIGVGQTSRVDAIKIAIKKASNNNVSLTNTILASDAFFPFKDSIDLISSQGTKCIIQPGGSIRDNEVIEHANKNNISMIFTNKRYFKH